MSLICQNCRAKISLDIDASINSVSDYKLHCPKCHCTMFIEDNERCQVNLVPFIKQYVDESVFANFSFEKKVNFIAEKLKKDEFTVDITKICIALKELGLNE